jgi:hypothetical protein
MSCGLLQNAQFVLFSHDSVYLDAAEGVWKVFDGRTRCVLHCMRVGRN